MEFAEKLKSYIEEETGDFDKYMKLAAEAPEKYAPIIRDIAKEEAVHKRHLENILADCGCSMNEEEAEPVSVATTKTAEKKHADKGGEDD